ncbi:hypothetical protein OG792_10515 [Micromonospora sp. NBC_01699]|uniref:hypothetical protein n=1 Tax=Micromonospora sp. NBC_01699 TaxID=2975984 RepID=UPI002E31DFF9|nr:hypothetical protein [Micromonospora sp. NBC_01699]
MTDGLDAVKRVSAEGAAEESGRSLVKVTVNLVPGSARALELACGRTRDSKTDTINRALVAYNLVLDLIDHGDGSLTLRNPDGSLERVHLI